MDTSVNQASNEQKRSGNQPSLDDPILFMLDLMVEMIKAFIEGIKLGYQGMNKGKQKSNGLQDAQMEQMQMQMQSMMQTMVKMLNGMQQMQAAYMQNNASLYTEQEAPEKNGGLSKADPEKAEKPEEAKQEIKPETVTKAGEKQDFQPDKKLEPQPVVETPKGQETAQNRSVKPIKWYSAEELEKAIKAVENMRDKKGKLSYTGERYLKSLVELKSDYEKNPDGIHAGPYVRLYNAANSFMAETSEALSGDKETQAARESARMIRRRLNTEDRIDKYERIERIQRAELKKKEAQALSDQTLKEPGVKRQDEKARVKEDEKKKETVKRTETEMKTEREKKKEIAKSKRVEERLEKKQIENTMRK